jgi:hypothetical protein
MSDPLTALAELIGMSLDDTDEAVEILAAARFVRDSGSKSIDPDFGTLERLERELGAPPGLARSAWAKARAKARRLQR